MYIPQLCYTKMGRESWAKINQTRWLEERIPLYREAQSQRTLRKFYPEVTAAFFQAFRLVLTESDGSNGVQVADGGVESEADCVKAPNLKKARNVRLPLIYEQSD